MTPDSHDQPAAADARDDRPPPAPALEIALVHPQIPNNTGNIGRTAVATDARLHVIHPIGFDMDAKARRRAGLDYWDLVDCREHASWERYLGDARPRRAWLFTARAERPYWDATFEPGDHLVFGREADGAPPEVHAWIEEAFGPAHRLAIPMTAHPRMRSLNLATAAAIAAYEARRQFAAATAAERPLAPRDGGEIAD